MTFLADKKKPKIWEISKLLRGGVRKVRKISKLFRIFFLKASLSIAGLEIKKIELLNRLESLNRIEDLSRMKCLSR